MNSKKKYIIATAIMNVLMPVCSMQAAAGQVNDAAARDMQEEAAAGQGDRKVLEIGVPQMIDAGASEEEEAAKKLFLALRDIGFGCLHKQMSTLINEQCDAESAVKLVEAWTVFLSLIESGVDVNVRNEEDKTPLHFVAEHADTHLGCDHVVEALINFGADIDALDADGKTPFILAVESHSLDMAMLLLSYGADAMVKDAENMSADDYLKERDYHTGGKRDKGLLLSMTINDPYSFVVGRGPWARPDKAGLAGSDIAPCLKGNMCSGEQRAFQAAWDAKVLQKKEAQRAQEEKDAQELLRILEEKETQRLLEEIEAQRLLKEQETQRLLEEREAQRVQEAQEDQRILEEGCKNFQAMIAYAAREDNQEMFKWLAARNPEQAAEEKCAVCLNTMPELVAAQTALCNVGEVCQHVICKPCKRSLEENKSLTCSLCRAYSGSSADLSLSWGDTAQLLLRPAMWGYFKRSKQIQQIHRDSVAEFQAKFELFRPSYEYLKQQFNAERQDEEVKEAAARANSPFEFSIVVNK